MEELFWADQLAKKVLERSKGEGKTATFKAGQSPSGAKHIGNINDNIRSYFPFKILHEKGEKCRHVQTHDDRDPLRKIPERLADLEGKWVVLSEEDIKRFQKYTGMPYVSVPDYFGCCKSWAAHFSKLWERGCAMLGLETQYLSNDQLYREGAFLPYVKTALEKIELTRKTISKFQKTRSEGYVPFNAICENCGKITGDVISFDLEAQTAKYVCEKRALAGEYEISGCGHKGEATFSEGKLAWRFEWPAQWGILGVTFEAFGKDHYEGSWPSGQEIAKKIYGIEPPIPFVYEFFLIDGEKMSTRHGNAYIVQDMMKIMEPEVFLYFYTKRPAKQRDLSLKEIFRMVDEFDRAEQLYFSNEKGKDADNLRRSYYLSVGEAPEKAPIRIPFTLAAMVSQVVPEKLRLEKALEILEKSGKIKGKVSEEDRMRMLTRLDLAKCWARTYASEENKITLIAPDKKILEKLSEKQKEALAEFSKRISKKEMEEEEVSSAAYAIAKELGLLSKEVFSAIYLVLLGKEFGPRLGSFVLAIGQKEIARRLALS